MIVTAASLMHWDERGRYPQCVVLLGRGDWQVHASRTLDRTVPVVMTTTGADAVGISTAIELSTCVLCWLDATADVDVFMFIQLGLLAGKRPEALVLGSSYGHSALESVLSGFVCWSSLAEATSAVQERFKALCIPR